MVDETDVWDRARGGDSRSFATIFDTHYDRVMRHALRLAPTLHDAEDIAALVFLEAWRKRSAVRVVDGSVLPWLLVTANYVSLNAARTSRRHRIALAKLPPQANVDDPSDAVLDGLDASGRDSKLRRAFGRLSKNDRDVLTLCVVSELSLAQAAETLGVPVGTVKSRLSRAKERLATLTGLAPSVSSSSVSLGEQK
jgi:RNA polymerase sigma-70 factor (ECF subfamily)